MLRHQIPKEVLLSLLYSKGYEIEITKEPYEENRERYHYIAKFKGAFRTKTPVAGMYSLEFTEEEIRRDLALELLQWSGDKVVYALD